MDPTPHVPDPALHRALDAWRADRAGPQFREGLRVRFARGEQGTDLEAILDDLRPGARPEFREQLRGRFLSALDELEPLEVPPTSPRRRPPPPPLAVPDGPRRPRRLAVGVAAFLALAASVLLWLQLGSRGAFQVDATDLIAAGLRIGGEAVPADATAASLGRRLEGAQTRTVTTGPNGLRFVYRDQFVIELGGQTHLDYGGLRGGGPMVLAGDRGTYRVATGPGFAGARRPLEFHTPARNLRVVGTVFGVDVFDRDTVCICCNQGEVLTWSSTASDDQEPVGALGTLLSSASGPMRKQNFEAHQGPLRALGEFWKSWKRR